MNSTEERYSRQIMLPEVGSLGQKKLANARVLVVGVGGLGCPALQYLSGAGVGTLGFVDHDKVSLSNLHRQLLFTTQDIGKSKVEVAKVRLEQYNPTLNYHSINERLTLTNAETIISKYDIIVDATDNLASRYLINDICIQTGKPMVYGSVYKFEGQIAVFNYQGSASYRCAFGHHNRMSQTTDSSLSAVLGMIPGYIALLQAMEVVKIILNIGTVLTDTILYYNPLSNSSYSVKVIKNDKLINDVKANKNYLRRDYNIEGLDQFNAIY